MIFIEFRAAFTAELDVTVVHQAATLAPYHILGVLHRHLTDLTQLALDKGASAALRALIDALVRAEPGNA